MCHFCLQYQMEPLAGRRTCRRPCDDAPHNKQCGRPNEGGAVSLILLIVRCFWKVLTRPPCSPIITSLSQRVRGSAREVLLSSCCVNYQQRRLQDSGVESWHIHSGPVLSAASAWPRRHRREAPSRSSVVSLPPSHTRSSLLHSSGAPTPA